jgi:glycosyltransferase involved in cell wall biosynthesis
VWPAAPALAHPVTRPHVVALVAAYNEEQGIARVVKSLLSLDPVAEVVVAADGSTDRTAQEAATSGAHVLLASGRRGKGGAIEAALAQGRGADVYVLVDGDVGDTAAEVARVLAPVLAGDLDLAIGVLPPLGGGGFGMVKRMAGMFIGRLAGFAPRAPLSGQRAATARTLEACRPLAAGFGLETAMTIDAARLGFRIGEVDVEMSHRATGRGFSGFLHRGRQGADILRAVVPRALRIR